jgi:S1-C subfamily serine protease
MEGKEEEKRMERIKSLHIKMIYPMVRVRTREAGGSGTIIYSEKDPEKPEEFLTFILTNHHVVSGAIGYKKEYDSLQKKEIKREEFGEISVDVFDYVRISEIVSSNVHRATIVTYDEQKDIAILKLDTPKPMRHVAELIPEKEISKIKIFTPIYTVGCSLLHEPFQNHGQISSLKEIIEGQNFWMSNANSIFGNSGGAVFDEETMKMIGIPARITTTGMDNVVSWMGFLIPIDIIYRFFRDQELLFLFDKSYTYKGCMEKRQKLKEKLEN